MYSELLLWVFSIACPHAKRVQNIYLSGHTQVQERDFLLAGWCKSRGLANLHSICSFVTRPIMSVRLFCTVIHNCCRVAHQGLEG